MADGSSCFQFLLLSPFSHVGWEKSMRHCCENALLLAFIPGFAHSFVLALQAPTATSAA